MEISGAIATTSAGGRARYLGQSLVIAIAAATLVLMFFGATTNAQTASESADPIQSELTAMERRGAIIERAREQVLEILEAKNGCSEWFGEVDSDPAGLFRSLHFKIDNSGAAYVLRSTDRDGYSRFKHPWAARAVEFGGRNSVVRLNARGAFFKWASSVMVVGPTGGYAGQDGLHSLSIASYPGNTTGAQVTTLLHELGHVDGRLPKDDDSWDGKSSQNTAEVLRNCRQEIQAIARKGSRSGG